MTKFLRPFKFFSIVLLLLFFSTSMIFGQTAGDWRSAGNGNWTSLSSWQYYNGSTWVTPSGNAPQGYPGQFSSSGAVTIQAGHTITLGYGNTTPVDTFPMGKITIIGKLYLAGDNSNNPTPKFELDTQWVYVSPNVGIIEFNNKANLWIESTAYPGTAILTVNKNDSINYKSIIGDCSNNQDINFGPNAVSYCAGKKFTFDDLMTTGGSLNASISTIPTICQGGTVSLSGSYTGSIGTPVIFGWHIVDSLGNTQDLAGANVSFTNATGTLYTIKLTVSTTYDTTPFTNSETVTAAVNASPVAPVATAGTGLSCTSIRANWNSVSEATSYQLDVATDVNFTNMVGVYNSFNVGNVLSRDIALLTSGTTYYYRVRAFNGTCAGPNSNVITVAAPSPPAAPTGFKNGDIRCTQVDLTWNAVAGAETYTVERATDAGFSANHITVTGLTSTDYTFTGLSIGINYYFKVTAVNSCPGTNSSTIGPILTLSKPVKPTSVNVDPNTVLCSQFIVTWVGDPGAVYYTVEASTDSGFSTDLHSFTNIGDSPFKVTGLSPNNTYYYRVIAVNGCGSGTPEEGLTPVETLVSAPDVTNLVTPTVGCNQLTVNWAAAARAANYTVELSTDSGFSSVVATGSSTTDLFYTFTNLIPSKLYYYRVMAHNGCGDSGYGVTSTASSTTGSFPAAPIIKVNGVATSSTAICQGNTVTLTSDAPSGNVWSTGASTPSIDVTTAGSYSVKVVNPGGCVSPVSSLTTVTVQPAPTAFDGGTETICSNTGATISSASASFGTIVWTISGGTGTLTNASTITPIFTPPLGGPAETVVLTMTVTGINSCSSKVATASHTVNVLGGSPTAAAGGSQTICIGGSATVGDASATNDSAISWTHNGAGTLTNESTLAPTYTPAIADAGKSITLTMSVTGSPSCVPPYVVTAFETVSVSPLTILTSVSQSAPVCDNSVATINLTGLLANSNSTINYTINNIAQTAVTGVVADASGNASFDTRVLSFADNGQTLTITGITNTSVTPNCSATFSQSATLSVLPSLPASVTITASPSNVICSGTSVTFTATPTNEGTAPAYQWYKGATAISGETTSTYVTTTLANGESISVVMTSNATPCLTGSPATSNTITMTVNPNLPASVIIGASPSNVICSGTSVTFNATPTNGGVTPVYQWKLNGNDVGTNSATYNDSALVSGDVVTCVMTSNAVCATGSPTTSNSVTMTVNPNLPASVSIIPSGRVCADVPVTFTATPINGGAAPSYQWKVNGLDVGIGEATYDVDNLLDGDVVTCVMTSYATCATGSPATSNGIIPTPSPQAPVLPPTLDMACSATSFVASWNAEALATSYFIDVATDKDLFNILPSYYDKGVGNVLSENVTGLTSGATYYVEVRAENSCGSSNYSNTMVVSVPVSTYNGTWDIVPDKTRKAVFASNFSSTNQLNACSCQVNDGVNVVVGDPLGTNTDAVLKLENGLDVLGTGTLTFENNASLIQVNEAMNTGKIRYKRITAPMKNFDFTYWCSPVLDQLLNVLSPNTLSDKYLSYTGSGWVSVPGGSTMNPEGKGFAIRVPKPQFWPNPAAATYAQPVEFFGVPYNGSKTIAALGDGVSNLIGNPYPSALDADEFIKANASLIRGSLNFWTHSTAITKSGSFYVYDPNDYASYNLSGGTAATLNGVIPNGKIAAGQSFFVISTSKNDFVFNNIMRNTAYVLQSDSNSQFFRMSETKKMAALEKNRVWLNLTNSGGAFKQLLVGYITGATNDIDNLYDGNSLNANAYVDFYSVNSGKNLVIQGRALPFTDTDEVPLGYRTTIQGNFTIGIAKTDGVLVNQDIFIEDKVAGTVTNLKNGSYTFSTATGVFNSRFVLKFIASGSSSKIASDTADKTVLVSVKNKQITINSLEDVIDKVMIYDLKASLLFEKENVNSTEFNISNFNYAEQFLIVQLLLRNGKWVTKEIIF